jgi:hypothetical protein
VVFQHTCSSPTTTATKCGKITQASSSVYLILSPVVTSGSNRPAGEVGKQLGEKWKELSAKDKEPYDKKAKEDKERYEREKAEYAVRLPHPLPEPTMLTDYKNKGAAEEDEDDE